MLIKQFSLIVALLDVHYNLSSRHHTLPLPQPTPPTQVHDNATLEEAMDKSHGLNLSNHSRVVGNPAIPLWQLKQLMLARVGATPSAKVAPDTVISNWNLSVFCDMCVVKLNKQGFH